MTGRGIARALVTALALGWAAAPAHAQIVRNFTPRFTTNDNGDVALIGNTILSCSGGTQCNRARNGTGGNLNNNDFSMVYVDVDGVGATFSSSTATLAMPAGAQVLWAGLYWGGDSNNAARNTCRLTTPAAAAVTLTATQLDVTGGVYQGYVDVTARVQAGGNGVYTVANVYADQASNSFGGWSLVVVYRLVTDPPRNLVVFDGFGQVAPGATITMNVNGFLTPPAGAVNTRLGVVAHEGDLGYTGDAFRLNGTALGDAPNPANNFFNSSVARLGTSVTAKNPNYLNQLGFDVDLVAANGILPNNATGATITLTSTDDRYYPGVVTFATDLYSPVLSGNGFVKTVTDLNGAPARPGDVLEYSLRLLNTGDDSATNVVVRDTVPSNAVFVPGSITVASGPGAGAKTDAAGDDGAEYVAASREVVLRLGAGATAVAGGTLGPDVQTVARFRVTVGSPTPNGSTVSNQAVAGFTAAQLGTALTSATDGDTTTAGIQRTNLAVTAPVMSGVVFEDPNYGGGAGRTRAASSGVVRAGARVELYASTGAFAAADTTDAAGAFAFDGWAPGAYTVRVVSSTVTSSRTGATPALAPIQTFRTDATTGTAVADPHRVGGEIPARADAPANLVAATLASLTTATTTAQSVAPVTLGTANLGGLDFGFNFSTVVNANDAGPGSLRQALVNANALANAGLAQAGLAAGLEHVIFMVSDGAAHPGLRAGLPNLLTGGVVAVNVASALPAITEALVLDGASQTTNVGDTNAGTLGAGGAAGVDGLAVALVARPEVQIRDGAAVAIGLDLQASNVTLARIAVYGFGNAAGSDANANVRVGAAAANALIEACVLGTPATSFADPGAAARSGGDNLRSVGGDDGIVRQSLIGFAAGNGIGLNGASSRWQVIACEIRGNAIGNPARDGIALESSANDVIRGNRIADHEGSGIDVAFASSFGVFENNTITRSGLGATETPGIRLVAANGRVDRCVLADNYGAGVLVASSAAANTITRNSMYGNGAIASGGGGGSSGQIGIDLLSAADDAARGTAPFRTRNDLGDGDAGGNGLLNFPVLETAVVAGGNLTVTGWARPGSAIELFVADPDPSGFGEGRTFVAALTEGAAADLDGSSSAYAPPVNGVDQGADNTSRFRFTLALPPGVSGGTRLTATATIALATSEFSGLVVVEGGVAVSGYGYADADHDRARDAGEAGTGAALWVKLVPVSAPGAAMEVVAVDATTGAYAFGFVPTGDYTIVLDTNASAADVTPTYPATWIGTEAPAGARPLTVAASNLADQDFGLWRGSRVEGTVFRDDGAGGGSANDGTRQGAEAAVAGVALRATAAACAGGVCDSTLTDGAGAFALWLPHSASGAPATVSATNLAAWLSTGGGAGTTGGAYARPADAVTFTPASGVVYTGVRFGDVPPHAIAPAGARSGGAGGVVFHPHVFTAGTAGSVTFSYTASPSPAIPGWSALLYRDLDCDGAVDPGEPLATAPLAVTAGQNACLVLRHSIPAGAPPGAAEQVRVAADASYTGAAPALSATVDVVHRTVVTDGGSLEIVKSVNLATARPGDLLTYTIVYRNLGPAPLSAIAIQDATPSYTVFQSAACGSLGAGIGACGVATQPAVGGTGTIAWTLAGALAPGASGTVTFTVEVR